MGYFFEIRDNSELVARDRSVRKYVCCSVDDVRMLMTTPSQAWTSVWG